MRGIRQIANTPTTTHAELLAVAGFTSLIGYIGAFCFFAIDAGLKLLGA